MVYADVSGRFQIKQSVRTQIHIRAFGYRDTTLWLERDNQEIYLQPVYNKFEEVTITPKEDRAYGIVR